MDPSDWRAFRKTAHAMLDDALDQLSSVRERPVWTRVPPDALDALKGPAPEAASDLGAVHRDFDTWIRPYPLNNIHPRFFGWALGGGTPVGMLGELLAAGLNTPAIGGTPDVATLVEDQVLQWMKSMVSFPREASGLLVSGGSMANLIALTVARNAGDRASIKEKGLAGSADALTVYGSMETHFSVQRAIEVLGIGSDQFRRVAMDADHRIDLDALRRTIDDDVRDGKRPICIVGNAGTTSTGAIDDLVALSTIAKERGLWFHVDGAIGAVACLSKRLRPRLDGIERADSLAFDLHKWLQVPFAAGCVLVRSASDQASTFSFSASYITNKAKDSPLERGIELTRPFRALKIWMSIKTHGLRAYRALIDRTAQHAAYLGLRIEKSARFELVAPVSLNIVCFRCVTGDDDETRNRLNYQLMAELKRDGIAIVSQEQFDKKICLRVSISNHRTTREDMAALFSELDGRARRLGATRVIRPRDRG